MHFYYSQSVKHNNTFWINYLQAFHFKLFKQFNFYKNINLVTNTLFFFSK